MTIYERDPDRAPDSEFEPGRLHHLVPGNTGRMMDPRRTPVSVVGVRPDVGVFVVRIDGFEDTGARWEIGFEDAGHYQFVRGSRRADRAELRTMRAAIRRFDRTRIVPRNAAATAETRARLETEREAAARWLGAHSAFFASGDGLPDPAAREGHPLLFRDLCAFMTARDLWDIEAAFARQFVSNPYSGETVKGHRIVLAELGLVAYHGKVVRDPRILEGAWSRTRRAAHILARLGFVHAFLARAGCERVMLYRGYSTEEPLAAPRNDTFVSTSFSPEVAQSHYDDAPPGANRVLVCQAVPVPRVFMTYLETETMNHPFKEGEAVLLFDETNPAF